MGGVFLHYASLQGIPNLCLIFFSCQGNWNDVRSPCYQLPHCLLQLLLLFFGAAGLLPFGSAGSTSSSSSSSSLDLLLLPSPLGIVIPIGLHIVPLSVLSFLLFSGLLSVSSRMLRLSSSVSLLIRRSCFFLRSLSSS